MYKSENSYAMCISTACKIPHTSVCKHTPVYDDALLQYSIPPTWRRRQLL